MPFILMVSKNFSLNTEVTFKFLCKIFNCNNEMIYYFRVCILIDLKENIRRFQYLMNYRNSPCQERRCDPWRSRGLLPSSFCSSLYHRY